MTRSASPFRIVLSTCSGAKEAERIARAVIDSRLGACVNILTAAQSFYRWNGKVESASEALLVIKTDARHIQSLEKLIRAIHSYELPEFLVLEIAQGSAAYLQWIASNLSESEGVSEQESE